MNDKLTAYLEKVFSSQENFEKIVFEVETEEDRTEVMRELANYVIKQGDLKHKLNFNMLKSYNALDVSDLAFAVVRVLFSEAAEWIEHYFPDVKDAQAIIQEDRLKMYTLHSMAMNYFDSYSFMFYDVIAETFFELISKAESFRHVSKVAQEAISGTARHRSLFMTQNGSQIIRRADQVWIRVDQAKKTKKRSVYSITNDVKKSKAEIEDMTIRIKAFDTATKLTPEQLKHYSTERVRDIFTEDNPKFIFDRRVLQSIPSGELAFAMETFCERAAINAKTPIERDDFKQIQAIFAKAKLNNTPKELKLRKDELLEKLPGKKKRYKELVREYQVKKDKPIYEFDEQLKKIKEVMVDNLSKRKVER